MGMNTGYKNTEIGVIPEEWGVTTIDQIADVKSGKRLPLGCSLVTNPTPHPYIRVADMLVGTVSLNDIKYVPEDVFPAIKRYRIYCEDIFISVAGSIGIVGKIPNELNGANLTENADRITNISCSQDYLLYIFMSPLIQTTIDSIQTVGAQPKLALTRIRKFTIPLPPLPEQHAIAAALSDVDALLAALDRLIAKKRDLKQATMQQLLTGQTRLAGFSGEWEVKRLGEAGKCLRGVTYKGDSDLSTHDTAHTKRLLRSNNVQNAIVNTNDIQFVNRDRVSTYQILERDDILICMANGSKSLVGKAGIFMTSDGYDYTFGAFMACFRTNMAEAHPSFVFYLFQTSRYRDYINNLLAGSSINNLRPSSIESLEFSMPPRSEQTAIVNILLEMDTELSTLEQRRDKTRALKQGMMQELLTGRTRLI
jgi:type I restriction enzyme S subunit